MTRGAFTESFRKNDKERNIMFLFLILILRLNDYPSELGPGALFMWKFEFKDGAY